MARNWRGRGTKGPAIRNQEIVEMEKYAVKIDPKKVNKEKTAGAGNKMPHPDTNVPHDPEKGTKPYETDPDKKAG